MTATLTPKKKVRFNIVLKNGETKQLLIGSIGTISIALVEAWLFENMGKLMKDKAFNEDQISHINHTEVKTVCTLFIPALEFKD